MTKREDPRNVSSDVAPRKTGIRLFVPILAGARLGERMIACLGALLGIVLTGLICRSVLGDSSSLPLIVAPLGASAVLLFAVPTSPLAQPWAIIGGNTISALIGVAVAHLIPDQILAIGFGVSLAIAAMSFARCLHPPGGATALTAIIGGPIVTSSGYLFPFVPVGLNSVLLVGLGYLFHKISRRTYPHRAPVPSANPHQTSDISPELRVGFRAEDIDKALEALSETFDISPDDLETLLRQVELQAMLRSHGTILCGDIMSRDVVTVGLRDSAELARSRLLLHNVRTLPVLGKQGQLVGTVGLRELMKESGDVGKSMSPAATATMQTPAVTLLPTLTDGRTHAVIIVDQDRMIQGLITQTDLLSAVAKLVPVAM
ncbi:HPP family protein [Tardiphaga sp. 862_B3_N4_1]|jgi:CBS domain-containing membrane protein|uniref:HPP family protein n=1 Tax=unclassified Tardiphaga TaxID=2631404 RepID=UPI003F1E7E92